MNGSRGVCGLDGSDIFISSPLFPSLPSPAPSSRPVSTASHIHYTPSQAQVFKFQKLSNSLVSPVEDARLVSRLAKGSSCFLSICGVRLLGSGPGPCSSACVLRAESCQGTCQRSTPKICPLSCMPASTARPGLSIGPAVEVQNAIP
jgi:hypothetical protein